MLITNFSGIKELVLLGNSLFIFTMSKISKSLIFYFTHKKNLEKLGDVVLKDVMPQHNCLVRSCVQQLL